MPTNNVFRKLLKADSSAELPASEDAVEALFDLYRVRPEARPARGPKSSRPTTERLELAAAILWFHTHVNDPEPALSRLPDYDARACLAECFVEDFAIFSGDSKWPSKLASFFKFAAPSGSTPQKRAARPARGGASASGQRVDKGVPSGRSDDQDSDIEGSVSSSAVSGRPDSFAMGLGPSDSGPPELSGLRDDGLKKQKRKKKGKKSKRSKKRRSRSSSSSSDSSDSAFPDAEPDAGSLSSGPWSLPASHDDSKGVRCSGGSCLRQEACLGALHSPDQMSETDRLAWAAVSVRLALGEAAAGLREVSEAGPHGGGPQ